MIYVAGAPVNTLYAHGPDDPPGLSLLPFFCCFSVVSLLFLCCFSVVSLLFLCCFSVVSLLFLCPYCTALIMSKIGRYMATTMPPTTTPRNTIMIGSISESRPLTAASTSSS